RRVREGARRAARRLRDLDRLELDRDLLARERVALRDLLGERRVELPREVGDDELPLAHFGEALPELRDQSAHRDHAGQEDEPDQEALAPHPRDEIAPRAERDVAQHGPPPSAVRASSRASRRKMSWSRGARTSKRRTWKRSSACCRMRCTSAPRST